MRPLTPAAAPPLYCGKGHTFLCFLDALSSMSDDRHSLTNQMEIDSLSDPSDPLNLITGIEMECH